MAAGPDRSAVTGIDRLEALLSSSMPQWAVRGRRESTGVFPHVSDDHVGELTFVAATGCALGLVPLGLAGQVGLRRRMAAGLGDVHAVEDRVHGTVAAEVETVSSGWPVTFAG